MVPRQSRPDQAARRASGTLMAATAMAARMTGTGRKKAARQDIVSMSQPPNDGPSIAMPPEMPAHKPIAWPLSFSGKQALIIASDWGTISAAPAPCNAWKAISRLIDPASPDSIAPMATTKRPRIKMRWRPK